MAADRGQSGGRGGKNKSAVMLLQMHRRCGGIPVLYLCPVVAIAIGLGCWRHAFLLPLAYAHQFEKDLKYCLHACRFEAEGLAGWCRLTRLFTRRMQVRIRQQPPAEPVRA